MHQADCHLQRQLVPGQHYAAVDTVEEVPDMVRRLQADPEAAQKIALAGQNLMASMDVDEVTHYCYQVVMRW